MTAGRIIAGAIVLAGALGGAAVWYTAERAYYAPVEFPPGREIQLVSVATGMLQPIKVDDITGIDAISSPIKFRACFRVAQPLDALAQTYQLYPDAEPLNAPSHFPCFDAKAIAGALGDGQAVAFLSEPNITYGIDRIVAITRDGRGYAWHQINPCGKEVFAGRPAPEGCPPVPKGQN